MNSKKKKIECKQGIFWVFLILSLSLLSFMQAKADCGCENRPFYAEFHAAPQNRGILPSSTTLQARELKEGAGDIGDFDLPADEQNDIWTLPSENFSASHPNPGLGTVLRGPPGGTPNMVNYNRV